MDERASDWLEEIAYSVRYIQRSVSGRTLDDCLTDDDLRPIVERKFEIIGENVIRLRDHDPLTVVRITDFQRIIGLRNVIAHAYGSLDDRQKRNIVQRFPPILLSDAESLISGSGPT